MSAPGDDGQIVVFDLETQNLFDDVGGQRFTHKLRVSVAVSCAVPSGEVRTFSEETVPALVDQLFEAKLVVGYNILKFDYAVLRPYSDRRLNRLPTLDLMDHLYRRTGFRSSLNAVAGATIGAAKTADGLEAVEMWRDGRIEELSAYCRSDVELTRNVYLYGKEHGAVFIRDRSGRRQRVPVMW